MRRKKGGKGDVKIKSRANDDEGREREREKEAVILVHHVLKTCQLKELE